MSLLIPSNNYYFLLLLIYCSSNLVNIIIIIKCVIYNGYIIICKKLGKSFNKFETF